MVVDEVVQLIEERTGLTRQWAFDVVCYLFSYAGRDIKESVLADAIGNTHVSGLAVDKIQNPVDFFRSVSAASDCIVRNADNFSKALDIEGICHLLGGDKGEIIAELIKREAPVYVKAGVRTSTEIDIVNGIHFSRGLLSPYFATTDDSSMAILNYPAVFLTGNRISSLPQILPLLEKIVAENRQLLIVADDFSEEILQTLVVNKQRGTLNVAAVRAPGFGERRKELLKDIAVVTGGFVFRTRQGRRLMK